jgi:hypothetical protein
VKKKPDPEVRDLIAKLATTQLLYDITKRELQHAIEERNDALALVEKKERSGWECPRCGTINAPISMQCHCPRYYFEYTAKPLVAPVWTKTSTGDAIPPQGQSICSSDAPINIVAAKI